MTGVFINYRGDDSQTAAALIDRELTARFGSNNVFMDSRSIPAGVDFAEELLGRLRTCSVVLVVIGPRWLTLTDAAGRPRISDPQDWIRREIVAAFSFGLRVIPVLIDGGKLPAEAELPADIAGLSRRQYVPLRRRYAAIDLDYLVEQIIRADPGLATASTRHRVNAWRSSVLPWIGGVVGLTAFAVWLVLQFSRHELGQSEKLVSIVSLSVAIVMFSLSVLAIVTLRQRRRPFTDREIRELAKSFNDSLATVQLLEAAGLERGRYPTWQASNADQFWREVNALVASGIFADGRQRILAQAHRKHPANPAFLPAQPNRVRYWLPLVAGTTAVILTTVWLAGRVTTSMDNTQSTPPSSAEQALPALPPSSSSNAPTTELRSYPRSEGVLDACPAPNGNSWHPIELGDHPTGMVATTGGTLTFKVTHATWRELESGRWQVSLDAEMENSTTKDLQHGSWHYDYLVLGKRQFTLDAGGCFSAEGPFVKPSLKGDARAGFVVTCRPVGAMVLVMKSGQEFEQIGENARIAVTRTVEPGDC
jgi:Effector-associated domain 1/TIR domain